MKYFIHLKGALKCWVPHFLGVKAGQKVKLISILTHHLLYLELSEKIPNYFIEGKQGITVIIV